jgi:hypothetical protein
MDVAVKRIPLSSATADILDEFQLETALLRFTAGSVFLFQD